MSGRFTTRFPGSAGSIALLLSVLNIHAAVLYVDLNSTNPVPPFASWNTAATNIQGAVDAANAGDQVLVADGTYQQGNRLTSDGVANRVVITNSVTLRSANGASVTSIDGGQAVRCVSLTNGASLVGFTFTRGKGGDGGGVKCASLSEIIFDCQFLNNSGVSGGGVFSGTLNNCTLSGNASGAGVNNRGGGAYGSILNYCTLTSNKTGYNVGTDGGGAFGCTLNYCTVNNNKADSDWSNGAGICNGVANNCNFSGNSGTYVWGGAAAYSSLTNCVITGNTADNGGGGYQSTLVNCTLSGNVATWGGGTAGGTLYNCIIRGNTAYQNGGGSYNGSLYNCTVVGNHSTEGGGGVASYGAVNCIIVDNTSTFGEPNYGSSTAIQYCCTTPMPASGSGNITDPPLFVNEAENDFHLLTNSPCVEAGTTAWGLTTADFDGKPRLVGNAPDIGAYEFQTPTYFAIQPVSQTNYAWYPTILTSLGVSPLPLHYQWEFNGIIMGGATQANLDLGTAQPGYAGTFRVIISNPFVTVRSSNAVLTVITPPPSLLSQPLNLVTNLGSNAVFSVSVFSPYPVSYQWQRDNTNLLDGGRFSGTTSSNLVIAGVQLSDAANYQVIVTNIYGAVTSAVATLTVLSAPVIVNQPSDGVATACSTTSFSVTVTGAPPIFYQWRKDGTKLSDNGNISGATGSVLSLANLQTTDSGHYSVTVSNVFGTSSSSGATMTVLPFAKWGNTWSSVPADATNLVEISAGGDFGWGEFNLALRGDGKVVAWGDTSFSSTNVPPDATNVIAVAAGDYHGLALRADRTVTAWGGDMHGEATAPPDATNVVALAAGQWHSLALRQDGTVVGWGESVPPPGISNVIAISAGGGYSVALRWDGTVIGWGANYYGATTPPAAATNVVALAAGRLHNLMLRDDGNIIGSGDILPPAGITNIAAIVSGNDASLALARNGNIIGWGYNYFGNTTPPANLSNVVALSAKEFHVMALVRDDTSHLPPRLVQQPTSCNPLVGQTAILLCHAIGTLPLRYQWFFNSTPLAGQTNYWLSLPGIQPGQEGNYGATIGNDYGSVTSQVAVVSERFDAAIAGQPASLSTVLGSNATFTVGMFGLPPFSYQWFFNGAPLTNNAHVSGADAASLTLIGVQPADGGNYSVVVSNAANSVASVVATLTVLMPAQLTSQPTNQSVLLNGNATFAVTATGTGLLNYQWQKSGVNLSNGGALGGVDTSTLTISGAQTNDTGDYHVIVANNYGATTSSVATLSVYVPAQITAQPTSQSVLLGSVASFSVAGTGTALAYQWFHDGNALNNDGRISGASAATLTLLNVQPSDVGGYAVLVTNLLSSATSVTASLTPLTTAGPSTRYVNLSNANPVRPYLSWAAAATTIQDAIDAGVNGDQIVVAEGVYQTGGQVVYGALSNRVVINKALTVRSLNGAASTIIQGNSGLGNNVVRPVYLTNNSSLVGFTIQNGSARNSGDLLREQSGGGVWCEGTNCFVINCNFVSNSVLQYGGGLFSGTSSNSTFLSNSANTGGGSFGSFLWNCTLATNSAAIGGGACSNSLVSCSLLGNRATSSGGGAYGCNLADCSILANTNSGAGGGLNSCIATGCTLSSNTAGANFGGGAYSSKLTNSFVLNNSSGRGGGVYGCVLNKSTIAGNFASDSGGSYQSTLDRCVIAWNRASGPGAGGNGGTFVNCLIVSNSTPSAGGGAFSAALTNCTVLGHTNNSAVYNCSLKNCIVYFNTANYLGGTFVNSCTTPLPAVFGPGQGNFTNAPLFTDMAAGDFHLQPLSPCINSGANVSAVGNLDLDGNPRIVAGTTDVGPYEFQTPASLLSYAWALQFGFAVDGSADFADSDGDGMNNWQEWIAGTSPTNALSVLKMLAAFRNGGGLRVTWQSVSGPTYFLQRATNLAARPAFLTIKTNILGFAGTTTFTDTTATNAVPYFYRVGVQ